MCISTFPQRYRGSCFFLVFSTAPTNDCAVVRSKTLIMTITVVIGSQFGSSFQYSPSDIGHKSEESCTNSM